MSYFAISNETWKYELEFDIYYSNPKNYVKCFRIFIFDGYNILIKCVYSGIFSAQKTFIFKILKISRKKVLFHSIKHCSVCHSKLHIMLINKNLQISPSDNLSLLYLASTQIFFDIAKLNVC